MKLNGCLLPISILAGILSVSCSFTVFDKVEVKATPSLNASIGSTNFIVSDYLGTGNVTKMFSGSSTMKAYSFKDPDPAEKDILKYMVDYPITEVELDFKKYLNQMDLTGNLQSSLAEQKFNIPTINTTSPSDITISLNTAIIGAVNTSLATPVTTSIAEPGAISVSPAIPALPVTIASLSTATLSAGSFNLAFSITGATPGLVATINSITLTGSSGTISQITAPVNAISGTASLPLAGKILEKTMNIVIACTVTGGTLGKTDTLRITPQLSADCAISAGTGINVSYSIPIPSSSVPVASDATFVSAVIDTGGLTITHNLPDMPGFTRTLALNTTGGLVYSGSKPLTTALPTNPQTVFDLNSANISNGNINVGGTLQVTAFNGSFSGMPATGFPVHLTTTTKIDIFKSVVVKPGSSFVTQQNLTQALPADLKDFVKLIKFNKIGVEVKFVNTLPAGNDMQMRVNSTALALNGTTNTTLVSNTSTTASFLNTNSNFTLNPQTTTSIDIQMNITPPGYLPATKQMTLNNITAGSTLSFSGTVTFIADWSSVVVDASTTPLKGVFPDAKGIDLSSIKQYLGDNLEFAQIPVYLYITGPTLGTPMDFNAKIDAVYTPSGSTVKTTKSLLNNPKVLLAPALPVFPAATSATPDVYNTTIPAASAVMYFETALNSKASDLVINYNLAPNPMTLTPADLTTNSVLKAEMVIVLPFAMTAKPNAAITFSDKPFDGATDLFNRNKTASADDTTNILLDSLSSMSLRIRLSNTTGLKGKALLTDKTPTSLEYFEKSFDLDSADQTLSLSKSELAYIRRHNPFAPKVVFTVPEGPFALKQSGGLDMSLVISASSDIDHTFNLGGK